jgi:hypothetical protein
MTEVTEAIAGLVHKYAAMDSNTLSKSQHELLEQYAPQVLGGEWKAPQPISAAPSPQPESPQALARIVLEAQDMDMWPGDTRYLYLSAIGKLLRWAGQEKDIITALLLYHNTRCMPRLSEEEVHALADSAAKCAVARRKPNAFFYSRYPERWNQGQLVMLNDYEAGWYARLQDACWWNAGAICGDECLPTVAKASDPERFHKEGGRVLGLFETVEVGERVYLISPDIVEQYLLTIRVSATRKEHGAKGGRSRLQ